jgi:hypothetical protein
MAKSIKKSNKKISKKSNRTSNKKVSKKSNRTSNKKVSKKSNNDNLDKILKDLRNNKYSDKQIKSIMKKYNIPEKEEYYNLRSIVYYSLLLKKLNKN